MSAYGCWKSGSGGQCCSSTGPSVLAPGHHWSARCRGSVRLVLDRPGWGLSEPVDFSKRPYRSLVADLCARCSTSWASNALTWSVGRSGTCGRSALPRTIQPVLDASCSWVAARSSPRFPSRASSGSSVAIGALVVRLPMTSRLLRSVLRQNGHGKSLDNGRIPREFIEWRLSLANDTASMRHERDMVRGIVRGSGWRSGFMFEDRRARADRPADTAGLRHGRPDRQRRDLAASDGRPAAWRAAVARRCRAPPVVRGRWLRRSGGEPVPHAVNRWIGRPGRRARRVGRAPAGRRSSRPGRMIFLSAACSRTWAVQPA